MKIKTTFLVLLAGSISSMHALETQKVSKTYGEIEKRLGGSNYIKSDLSCCSQLVFNMKDCPYFLEYLMNRDKSDE